MKAIQTRYLPATNIKPSRITAWAEGGNKVTISYPHDLDGEFCHAAAAIKLCQKLGWSGPLIGGGLPNGDYCFVFAGDVRIEHTVPTVARAA